MSLFAELSLRGTFPIWAAVLLGLAAVAAIAVLYARDGRRLGAAPRVLMAAVRAAILLVVAFLLLRPVWVQEHKGQKRRPVAVLIDVSQSMDSKDPRPTAADQWRAAIAYDLA